MDWIAWLFDFILHIDVHLRELIQHYGTWTYIILFGIVFCETGLVILPFLPGDSLLFAAGAFTAPSATGGPETLNLWWTMAVLIAAAIIGDTVNFHIGAYMGPRALHKPNARFLKKEYLDRTHSFFERYGGKTIIIARFVPIIRTFAPFLAGVGAMTYGRFIVYNVVGGILWVVSFVVAGHLFGNIPVVRKNFTLVIVAIIVISCIPTVIELWRHRSSGRAVHVPRPVAPEAATPPEPSEN